MPPTPSVRASTCTRGWPRSVPRRQPTWAGPDRSGPCGRPASSTPAAGSARPPATSNLYYPVGRTTDNLVHVPVGELGKISLYAGGADVNVVADVLGWTSNGGATLRPGEGLLHPTAPIRVLDTRKTSALGPGVARSFKVAGTGGSAGVPATGAGA